MLEVGTLSPKQRFGSTRGQVPLCGAPDQPSVGARPSRQRYLPPFEPYQRILGETVRKSIWKLIVNGSLDWDESLPTVDGLSNSPEQVARVVWFHLFDCR